MLFEPLFEHARRTPLDVAVIDDQGGHTYQQLAAMAAGMAAYLRAQTQKPVVGILLPAGAGFVASFYGTLLAGKSAVLINFLLGDREVGHVLRDSGIDAVITIPQLAGRLKDTPLKVIDLTQLSQAFQARQLAAPQSTPQQAPPAFPSPLADDMAVLMYTSGTSGLPKGVVLTYGNLQSDVDAAIRHVGLEKGHRFLGVIPLFHAFGMMAMMLAPIQLGAQVIYMSRFSPVGAIERLREHKVSIMFGVPSMFGAILHLKNASAADFEPVYAAISGGEPLASTLREAFLQRYGKPILEGYGLTETSPAVTFNTPQAMRPGSVGRAVPGAQIKIVYDDGNAQGTDQSGEIWLKGPMIMKGYFNLPEETAAALTPDGYFKTGDLGKVDADGYLYITGRKKDLIIVAGEKAVPREIEEVLLRHPAVADAAVVGKKDPGRGEVVVAFVVAKEGQTPKPDEIRTFCRDAQLATFKVPREVILVDEFPRSPTGKVLKRVLAEQLKN